MYAASQREHLKVRAPECDLIWFFRLSLTLNLRWHRWHSNGLSPVWIRICLTMWLLRENFLWQTPKFVRIRSLDRLWPGCLPWYNFFAANQLYHFYFRVVVLPICMPQLSMVSHFSWEMQHHTPKRRHTTHKTRRNHTWSNKSYKIQGNQKDTQKQSNKSNHTALPSSTFSLCNNTQTS